MPPASALRSFNLPLEVSSTSTFKLWSLAAKGQATMVNECHTSTVPHGI